MVHYTAQELLDPSENITVQRNVTAARQEAHTMTSWKSSTLRKAPACRWWTAGNMRSGGERCCLSITGRSRFFHRQLHDLL